MAALKPNPSQENKTIVQGPTIQINIHTKDVDLDLKKEAKINDDSKSETPSESKESND